MNRNKRDLAAAERLLRKFGDVKISAAVQNLKNPRAGHPQKWDAHKLLDVFLSIEAIKALGIKPTQAFKEFANHSRLTLPQVKYIYRNGRNRFWVIVQDDLKGFVEIHVNGTGSSWSQGRPALRDFLTKLASRTTTPPIR
jgi:hypothetical protein